MDDRQLKLRVGLVTIAALFVFFVLVGLNTPLSLSLGGKQQTVQIRVPRAPGVGRNTPVRRDGVLIGRVESTEPVQGGVLITATVTDDNPPLVSDKAFVQPSSLFGDAVINFEQNPEAEDRRPAPPDLVIQADASRDPLAALAELDGKLTPALESMTKAGNSVTELTSRVNSSLGELDQKRLSDLLANLDSASKAFTATMNSVNTVIGDAAAQQRLRQGISDLPQLIVNLREAASTADKAFASLDQAVVSAGVNLKNIEELTEPLGKKGPELVQLLQSSLENLDLTLADAQRFAKSLNDGKGSLSLLVNDRQMHDNLNTTVYNANATILRINELVKRLRPVAEDLRTAADKVAREPGRIIGGALKPGPGIK